MGGMGDYQKMQSNAAAWRLANPEEFKAIQEKQAQRNNPQAEAAKQSVVNSENAVAKAKQDQANQMAGSSLYNLISQQQESDAQSASKQALPSPVFSQPSTPGTMTNVSPIASRGVSISAPAQKMQAAGGMMPASGVNRINQAGPGAQNGMINAATPSQDLKFGGV